MHSVWIGLVVPTMFFLVWGFPEMRMRQIWWGCLALAVISLAVLVGLDLQQYLSSGGGASTDSFRRIVYRLITSIDFPLIAILIGSIVNLFYCGLKAADASPVEIAESNVTISNLK